MKRYITKRGIHFSIPVFFLLLSFNSFAFKQLIVKDSTPASTREDAIAIINNINTLPASIYWPNVQTDLFFQNVKRNITEPLSIYEGSYLNFCGYAALSYIPLHYDPVGYLKFILELYAKGNAHYGKIYFKPSLAVMKAAATIKFKGVLDINFTIMCITFCIQL